MGIDDAYKKFLALRGELPPDDDLPITDNEACTRVHLIDPLLHDVLGWPREHTVVEAPGGQSASASEWSAREGRVDYIVRDARSACWFVIEAKKRSSPIVRPMGTVRGMEELKLTGPVLKDQCWSIISGQMAPYLGRYMPSFGAVTTGEQWVGFLGKLRPDNLLLENSVAVVFRSLDDIDKDFEYFFEFFGLEGAQRRSLLMRLRPGANGLVRAPYPRCVVRPGECRPLNVQDATQFYDDLRRAMEAAFRPSHANREALAACFVESRESQDASTRLERVANELGCALRSAVDDYPSDVRAEVRTISSHSGASFLPGGGYLARLLGEKSAGKTVFLRRFFELQLADMRDHIVLLWLDVEPDAPFCAHRASSELLDQLRNELFGEDGPTWAQFREIYRREWNQHIKLWGVSEDNLDAREAFLREQKAACERYPKGAIRHYADFATKNRRRLVCLVVDNLDHVQTPRAVMEWIMSLHLSMFSMTTISMEDATLWRLVRAGIDQVGDHHPEQFWLHRPKVRDVVKNRCDYLKQVVSQSASGSGRTSTPVGRHGQVRWSVNPEELVGAVSAVLLGSDETGQWIGQLCNYDLSEVLDTCQQIVLSPQLRADQLLAMQVVQNVPRYRILRALIAPKHEQFRVLPTGRVTNIFGYWFSQDFAPLLPARLLAILRAREDSDRNRRDVFPGFVSVSESAELFERAAGVPRSATIATLRHLSTMRLVEPFNPADPEIHDADARTKITPRGRLHLDWALQHATYVRLMAEVDPIVDDHAFDMMRDQWITFIDVLRTENEANVAQRKEAEQRFVRIYVEYILELAGKTAPLSDHDEIGPARNFDHKLRAEWCRDQA